MEKHPTSANKNEKTRCGIAVPPSARLLSDLALLAALASVAMLASAGIAALVDVSHGQYALGVTFYALVITITLALVLGIRQLLRGMIARALAPTIIASVCAGVLIAAIATECAMYGTFFIVPFTIG